LEALRQKIVDNLFRLQLLLCELSEHVQPEHARLFAKNDAVFDNSGYGNDFAWPYTALPITIVRWRVTNEGVSPTMTSLSPSLIGAEAF